MRQISLLKQCNSVQLGHLYEHIFYAHLDTRLREKGFYQPLDYDIYAATYEGGMIHIELIIYADELSSFSIEDVEELAVSFSEAHIATAIDQIIAEKELPVGYESFDILCTLLNNLHAEPWRDLDEFGFVDTKSLRQSYKGFYISEGQPVKSRKLIAYLTIDKEFIKNNRQLSPLFRQVAGLIMQNFSLDLADSQGYFVASSAYLMTESTKIKSEFRVGNILVNTEEDIQYCVDIVKELYDNNAFTRLVNVLQRVSYKQEWWKAPNMEATYEDTAIFIGSEGWKEIATLENIDLLLKQMSIELRFGKQYTRVSAVNFQ